MPVHKRGGDSSSSTHSPIPPLEEEDPGDSLPGCDNQDQENLEDLSDSEESSTSSSENGENDAFIVVKLAEVRKEVQCPICLGIIRKTRTVMECLHRFCRECIDKSMRLGNNECPACRTHCPSRRSLRDDPNYDALISVLYPDIDKYEEEELIFSEEENARNEKIQASIAQTFPRQADALGKRRASVRASATASSKRHSSYKTRGRRNHHPNRSESDEDDGGTGDYGNRYSSSADEHSPETRSGRSKKRGGSRASIDADGIDNDLEITRLAVEPWGRHGIRSKNRHGGHSWTNGKISRHIRMAKLINHLQSSNKNGDVSKISLRLISLDVNMPTLKRPYVCCSTASSIKHLSQFVAMQTSVEASQIQMLILKDMHPIYISNIFNEELPRLDPNLSTMQLLKEHETLDEIRARLMLRTLVLGYMKSPQTA